MPGGLSFLLPIALFLFLGMGGWPALDDISGPVTQSEWIGLARLISHGGDTFAFVLAGAYTAWLCLKKTRELPRFLTLLAGQHLLLSAGKALFHTLRPALKYQVGGYAYPSGHTMMATCLYGYLAHRIPGKVRPVLRGLPWLVGWSRVALGHHWLRDVLGALLLGGVWVRLCLPSGEPDSADPTVS